MSQVELSVIVPCYNRQDTVRAAIASVLEQDYPNFEVIAVDDNSADGTWDVLSSIRDPRLRVVRNDGPRGGGAARNFGAALAHGRWLGFQDSDDLWRPGKLSAQMPLLKTGETVAVYCDLDVMEDMHSASGGGGERIPGPHVKIREGNLVEPLLYGNFISTQTLVVDIRIFHQVGGFDTSFPILEDWDLVLRIARTGPIAYVPEALAVRQPSENSISRQERARLAAIVRIIEKNSDLYRRYPAARAELEHRIAWRYRQYGEHAAALHHQWSAIRARPLNPRYWGAAGLSAVRALSGGRP